MYGVFHPETVEALRNAWNLRKKYLPGNRKTASKIKSLSSYQSFIRGSSRGLDLLIDLHQLFPTFDNSANYSYDALKQRAGLRLKYIADFDLPLSGRDLFDIGAGHGETIHVLQDFGLSSVTAFDYSDKDFKKFRHNLTPENVSRSKFVVQDLVEKALPINSADVIVSSSAFEHFMDPTVIIDHCYSALREGGILYTDFAAYHVPFAPHRKIFSGVPYIQNIFPDDVSFEFFYEHLRINAGVNRYTGEKITDGNPFPEVNRLNIRAWEQLLIGDDRWEVIHYSQLRNYQFKWFTELFPHTKEISSEDLYADELKFLLRKK